MTVGALTISPSFYLYPTLPLPQELYRVTVGARPPLTANSSAADLARLAAANSGHQQPQQQQQHHPHHPALSSAHSRLTSSENHVSAALQSALNNRGAGTPTNGAGSMYGAMNGVAASRSTVGQNQVILRHQ